MKDPAKKDKRLKIKLSEAEHKQVRTAAVSAGVRLSTLVRTALGRRPSKEDARQLSWWEKYEQPKRPKEIALRVSAEEKAKAERVGPRCVRELVLREAAKQLG